MLGNTLIKRKKLFHSLLSGSKESRKVFNYFETFTFLCFLINALTSEAGDAGMTRTQSPSQPFSGLTYRAHAGTA